MLLSKQHGLNPTISLCILCKKEKNEIALLGASYKEAAPMRMVTSIEPCDHCKEKYLSKGVMLVEAELNYNHRKIPTGKLAVLKDQAFKKMFNQEVPPRKIIFVEIGVLSKLGII